MLLPDHHTVVTDKQAVQKSVQDHRVWIVADPVMARNLRPGPDWVPFTVESQCWKLHAKQLKSWLLSPLAATPESESDHPKKRFSDDNSATESQEC